MAAQTAFAFAPVNADYAREDFLVSDANRDAMAWIESWPDWPAYGLIIRGGEASGKTHLAHIWAQAAQACFVTAQALGTEAPDLLLQGKNTVVLDGMEQIEREEQEEGLFHLLNHVKINGGTLLMTSAENQFLQEIQLPDLRSRLAALPVAHLHPPDDELLAALLRKQFSDRQLLVDDDVITWLLPRMERSFSQVRTVVETLDRASLQNRKAITVHFARGVLFPLKSQG